MLLRLLCADNATPESDASVPTDQMRMERFVAHLSGVARSQLTDSTGAFQDVCKWPDVRCNKQKRVVHIRWAEKVWAHGSVCLDDLPPSLMTLSLSRDFPFGAMDESIEGTLNASLLPRSLTSIDLSENSFSKEIKFSALPPLLQSLILARNYFTGSAALHRLPKNLKTLDISSNSFSGGIALDALPQRFRISASDAINLRGASTSRPSHRVSKSFMSQTMR